MTNNWHKKLRQWGCVPCNSIIKFNLIWLLKLLKYLLIKDLKCFYSKQAFTGLFSNSYPDCSALHIVFCGPLSNVLSDSPWSSNTPRYTCSTLWHFVVEIFFYGVINVLSFFKSMSSMLNTKLFMDSVIYTSKLKQCP